MSSIAYHRSIVVGLCFLGMMATTVTTSRSDEARLGKPLPIIFDTDIGNDVDDVLALGMIHSLQSRRECDLLAVTITKDHPYAAFFTDAVNTFYGDGDVPIGICRSGVTNQEGKFNGLAMRRDGENLRFPHDLREASQIPDAVRVLREALAGAEDGSVVAIQVGFSTNLANLLDSKPDSVSDLNGKELVQRKVKLLSMMAGAFEQIPGKEGVPYDHKEYNVIKDIPAAQKIASDWPTPVIWSGFEIGLALPYPHQSIENDYDYVEHHPLPEAYVLYNPPPHDRPTWDLTSVLVAVRPDHQYFELSEAGRVAVAEDGLTTFHPDENGRHRYLILKNEMKPRVLETLQLLSSEPPKS